MTISLWRQILLLVGTTVFGGSAASAQIFGPFLESDIPFETNRGRNTGVLERDRPELEPLGIRAGGFTVYPQMTIGGGYSDNVYGSTNNPTGDGFVTLDPTVRAESNWSRHALNASAGGAFRRFTEQGVRNENGYFANVEGRYDVIGDSNIIAAARIRQAYEAQYSGSFPSNAAEPIRFVDASALLRGQYQAGRFRFTIAGDAHNLNFGDARGFAGTRIDQDFRDRSVYRVNGRAEYALTPATAGFVQIGYARTDYDRRLATFNDNRDGDEVRALGGVTFDLTALMRASIGLGYVRRTFDATRFGTLDGLAYEARIEYFPTELTTLTFRATRTIEDAIVTGSSGYFASSFQLRADHELLRNVLLFVETDYQRNKFQGLNRKDDLIQATGGARYLTNRWFTLAAAVSYLDRDSKGAVAGQAFNEWRGTIAATFSY